MDLIFGNHKKLLKFKMEFMPQHKTAFDHIQDKTATAFGSKTIKIRLHLIQIFLYGFLSANQL